MRSIQVTGAGVASWVDIPKPEAGPRDVLLKIKACGICGSDAMYTDYGGIPPRQGCTPLGHEPAAEVVEVGKDIAAPDVEIGDHVVIDTMAFADGLLGSGGAQGALSEYVVVHDYEPGKQLKKIPEHIPWHVAALNEPMAVALHAVNRTSPKPGCKVVVFGAGPIGLGAVLGYRRKGASHITVVDVVASRLEKALMVGADAVVNSAEAEDLAAELVRLQGDGATAWNRGTRPGTDVFLDAAGAPPVPGQVARMAKRGATLGVVGVHKTPTELNFGQLISTELNIVFSMGYPTEIFEVTDDIVENWEKYAEIVSDQIPYDKATEALELARSGKANKVVVVFE
ncbi:Putative GroES-like superfamily, alcohol dehydrogenase-like, NAD(P)-binding domain superfamily [Colletotrichum destructivum]|uniref:GroES-like superfamily, alcohol dehydrogenase-like, NAD(P)-binding domain superfamily n=1 Tax=Colletotrichum destructivum TaxID=34406 RepID=A0AAX4INW7_9PEZI|nr:Putative GroES-like superfamily, alcohol dehydrogenase-like, NAD(P)-binding domain superfamily [Colletotrichum destructivum]